MELALRERERTAVEGELPGADVEPVGAERESGAGEHAGILIPVYS
jgi:hypothetical protein